MESCLAPSELLALAIEPDWAQEDPAQRCCLAVALSVEPELGQEKAARLGDWLAQQSVPIVGVAGERPSNLDGAMDLVAEGTAELERIREKIDRRPHACAALVQVLRATGRLDIFSALAVESLAYATLQGGNEFARWLKRQPPRRPKAAQPEDIVLLERRGDDLRVILNSPDNRNALSVAMRDALADAFRLGVQDASIARIEVSARGPCFSAGGDLTEFGTMTDLAEAHRIRMTRMPARYLAACRDRCTFHLHGACIGAGIEMPAFAARLTAKPDTTFRLPEVSMGLIPGAGGCVSIPRRIGRQRTARMAMLGEPVDAEQALDWGLIDAIVD